MGCSWNMPGNYEEGFTTCKGDRYVHHCMTVFERRCWLFWLVGCKNSLPQSRWDVTKWFFYYYSPMGEYIQPDGSTSTWSQEQTVTNTVLPSAVSILPRLNLPLFILSDFVYLATYASHLSLSDSSIRRRLCARYRSNHICPSHYELDGYLYSL
jgi:hypothetical protein